MADLFYEEVFRALNAKDIRYLIVGGMAVNLSGVPRMTQDLDVMLALDPGNLRSFAAAVRQLGYLCRAPIQPEELADADKRESWIRDKNAMVLTFYDPKPPHLTLDVFLRNPLDFESAYARRRVLSAEDISLPVACIDDLIEMKRLAGRAQDQADIAMLRKVKQNQEDGDG